MKRDSNERDPDRNSSGEAERTNGSGAAASPEERRAFEEVQEFPAFFLELLRAVFTAIFWLFHGLRYRGRENIPSEGPVIIAPNHVSYYDPLLVGVGIRRRLSSMAWDALFKVPLLGWGMRKLGAFPVDPKSADVQAYRICLEALKRGGVVQVFPEGHRGAGDEVESFRSGAARLALRSGATVVPVTITGAFESWPRWRLFPRPRCRIVVKFHRPIRVRDDNPKGEELRAAVEDLNDKVAAPIRRRYTAYRRLQRRKRRKIPSAPDGEKQ